MGETINRGNLISQIANKTGESEAAVNRVVDAFFEVAGDAISVGDKVVIAGWLTFERGHRAARQGVNPRTGDPLQIPATNTAKIKAGSKLKDKAKGQSAG